MNREFNIKDILKIVTSHIRLIIILACIGGIIAYTYTTFLVTPIYSARASILISNIEAFIDTEQSGVQSDTQSKMSSADLQVSQRLASTCSVLFTSDALMDLVIKNLGMDNITTGGLRGLVSFSNADESPIVFITVRHSNAKMAAEIANAIQENASRFFKSYLVGAVKPLDKAHTPSAPISPNVPNNTIYGFAAGLVVALVIAFFIEIIDTSVKPQDDLYKIYKIPVFASIVDFEIENRSKKL